MADQGVDLVITSGGLGPTADDLTIEMVAEFTGRPLFLDEDLEERIADILRPLMKRFRHLDFDAVRASNRKQALVPEGAHVIYPAGTAPGPRRAGQAGDRGAARARRASCTRCGRRRSRRRPSRRRSAAARSYRQQTLRLFGIPESEIAETLRVAEGADRGLRRARDHDLPAPRRGRGGHPLGAAPPSRRGTRCEALIAERHERSLFSVDGSTIDEQVAALLQGRWAAVAESCTGGLMAARLTERPGSSAYFAGGVVSYSNEAKAALLGVDPALIERHGAVSMEVAEAMADGALARFEADTAVAITGVAGPAAAPRPSRSATCAGRQARPTDRSSCATCACRAIAPRCATARPRSACTCCAGCCAGRTSRSERAACAHVRGARPADARRASALAALARRARRRPRRPAPGGA